MCPMIGLMHEAGSNPCLPSRQGESEALKSATVEGILRNREGGVHFEYPDGDNKNWMANLHQDHDLFTPSNRPKVVQHLYNQKCQPMPNFGLIQVILASES